MGLDALICPACLKQEPALPSFIAPDRFSIVLSRVSEDSAVLVELLRVLRVLSGDPAFTPRFLTEDRRLYSKEELQRSVFLPCHLIKGLDQRSLDILVPLIEGSAGKVKTVVKTDAAAEKAARRQALLSVAGDRMCRKALLETIKRDGVPPLLTICHRYNRPVPEGLKTAIHIEREALSLLVPRPQEGSSALPGCGELVQAASHYALMHDLRRKKAGASSDPLGPCRELQDILRSAAAIRQRMEGIDADIAEISPGRLQASIKRLSELIALEEGTAACDDLIREKVRAEAVYERYSELERRRVALASLLLETSTALDSLTIDTDLQHLAQSLTASLENE